MPQEPTPTKAELLERIASSRARLEQAIARVPTSQLVRPGHDGWSAKDHLAHLAAWERSVIPLLQGLPRHRALGVTDAEYRERDTDYLNARIHESHAHWTLAQVLTEFQTVHDDLLDAVARLTDDDLARPYSHFQPNEPGEDSGAPIVNWITGNTCDHFDEHLEWMSEMLTPA